jgi:HSP20 family protein
MSAQRSNQLATTQKSSGEEQRGLVRRSAVPSVTSLLLDPLGLFEDDSFSLTRRMQREMSRVFSQAGLDFTGGGDNTLNTAWMPTTEISYQDGNLVVSADLPGLSEKDVKVEINDDFLVIQGERKVERQDGEAGVRRTERRYGEFYRAIALPEGADAEKARAEFQNGVLRVSIPVAQPQSNRREIPIQTTATSSQNSGQSQASTSNTEAAEQKKAA